MKDYHLFNYFVKFSPFAEGKVDEKSILAFMQDNGGMLSTGRADGTFDIELFIGRSFDEYSQENGYNAETSTMNSAIGIIKVQVEEFSEGIFTHCIRNHIEEGAFEIVFLREDSDIALPEVIKAWQSFTKSNLQLIR